VAILQFRYGINTIWLPMGIASRSEEGKQQVQTVLNNLHARARVYKETRSRQPYAETLFYN
jgi:hypothetical protein